MLLSADARAFSTAEERFQACAYCGKELVVLPNDRRGGSCFDCLMLLGPDAAPCPNCGAEIAAGERRQGCLRCGWIPVRD
jgi:hypothetical protein